MFASSSSIRFPRFSITMLLMLFFCCSVVVDVVYGDDVLDKLNSVSKSHKFFSRGVLDGWNDETNAKNLVFWWTPMQASTPGQSSMIRFTVVGKVDGYVSIGFNKDVEGMVGSTAIVGVNNGNTTSVSVYFLATQNGDPADAQLVPNITLINPSVEIINSIMFLDFTWNYSVAIPRYFPAITDVPYVVAAMRAGPGSISYHDDRAYGILDLTNGFPAPTFLPAGAMCVDTVPSEVLKYMSCTPLDSYKLIDKNGNFFATVFWQLQGKDVRFEVVVHGPSDGWVSIGFPHDSAGRMIGTHAVVLEKAGQELTSTLITSEDPTNQPWDNKNIISIFDGSSWVLNGTYGFGFTRKLNDSASLISDPTSVLLIAARGLRAWPAKHDSHSDGAVIINLVSGGVTQSPFVFDIKAVHGILMYIAWVLLFPIGFLTARFSRSLPDALWFETHRLVMTLGFVITMISFCMALIMSPNPHFPMVQPYHQILGLVAVVSMIYQVTSAIMRPHADPNHRSPQRLFFEWTHHLIGRAAIIIAWVAIDKGLVLLPKCPELLRYIHWAIVIAWGIIYIVLEMRYQFAKSQKMKAKSRSRESRRSINYSKGGKV